MSLTARDGPCLKVSPSDTSDADTAEHGAETMNDLACAADVMATLCRMSLLREESLTVSGAYVRSPPTLD